MGLQVKVRIRGGKPVYRLWWTYTDSWGSGDLTREQLTEVLLLEAVDRALREERNMPEEFKRIDRGERQHEPLDDEWKEAPRERWDQEGLALVRARLQRLLDHLEEVAGY